VLSHALNIKDGARKSVDHIAKLILLEENTKENHEFIMQNLKKIISHRFLKIFSEFFNDETPGVKYDRLLVGDFLDAN
jgi:predicted nucleic acid-binding OB-fold protein